MRASRWLAAGLFAFAAAILMPAEAAAQRRAVPRPPGRSVVHVRVGAYHPVYYRPYYGYGAWYGWHGWPYFAQPYPYPYPYGWYYRDYLGEARLQVQPRHAQVFIDGYYVGVVDDFDGWSQRLRVEPGEHELEIYLEGYRSYRQKLLFRPGATLRIEHVLQPLASGDQPDSRPTPSPSAARPAGRAAPVPVPGRAAPSRSAPESPQAYGSVAIRVQPLDAEVIVDGERWESPEAGDLTLQLAEGTHRVEIRKDGYRTYSADIEVRRGEVTTLNVSLSRQQAI